MRERRRGRLLRRRDAGRLDRRAGRAWRGCHDKAAPAATLAGLRSGAVFSRKRAPRLLRGSVAADPSGLLAVKLRLTRRVGKTCSYFSGSRETFRSMRCGRGSFFKIGDRRRLVATCCRSGSARGRYVLEAKAIDGAFNRGDVTARALPGEVMRRALLAARARRSPCRLRPVRRRSS